MGYSGVPFARIRVVGMEGWRVDSAKKDDNDTAAARASTPINLLLTAQP